MFEDDSPKILAHRKEIFRGRFEVTYEWSGNLRKPVFVGFNESKLVPFPLRKVEDCPHMDGGYYIRTDVSFWWITEARIKAADLFSLIYHRIILTANVWGLAHTPMGNVPSWRDLLKKKVNNV